MFKRFAAEALGLSDVGTVVQPGDYDKVDADDYLFHEDQEKIHFLIKSRKDEYCFTNLALVHVDGDSAVSSKRTIRRYDYAHHAVGPVTIETAGTIDLDVELKFAMGDRAFSIDVRKDHLEALKDIYKALHTIGVQQRRDAVGREHAVQSASVLGAMLKLNAAQDPAAVQAHYRAVLTAMDTAVLDYHTRHDFGQVFEKYMHA